MKKMEKTINRKVLKSMNQNPECFSLFVFPPPFDRPKLPKPT